jgi:sodium-coupled neutral amino acid transporter 11
MCHHSTFLLYGSLKQPTEARWARLTHASVFTSALIEIFFALFGYATFTGFVQGSQPSFYYLSNSKLMLGKSIVNVKQLIYSPIILEEIKKFKH